MLFSSQNRAVAAESSFDSFENDYNMTSSDNGGGVVKTVGNMLTIGTGSTSDGRTSTVVTSKDTVDFTRNFILTGELTDTTTPDGFTITFQPDKDYAYINNATKSGTALCVYNVEGATKYAANSLITEVDTYDSYSIGSGNKTDGNNLRQLLDPEGTTKVYTPHLAISTLDSSGTESLQAAGLIKAGDDNQIKTVGKHKIIIDWRVTDHKTGTGIYTVTYDDKTISYADFNPETTFKTSSPYLTFTGSVDFSNTAQSDNPWTFEMKSFEYNAPILNVTETSDSDSKDVSGNEKINYTINIKNNGESNAVGVRVRRYMPDYTKFYSVDSSGEYGCINQKEHATWFIKSIPAGESATLKYTVVVDVCHPDNYRIPHKVYYEVTNSTTAPLTNLFQDPANIAG